VPDVRRAQIRTIDEALAFAAIPGTCVVYTVKLVHVQSSHPVISTDWLKPNRRKLIY
jgi:hypothetical protein